MSFIEINDLSFSYFDENENEIKILKNINLSINEGEFIGIIGHNGSGKSTFARLLNGMLSPTSGDVIVDGINTKNEDSLFDIRKNIGLVFQNPDNQIVATIVEEEVAFAPENLGFPPEEIRKRVDAALRVVGMSEFKRHSTYKLSGGQKQRIAIAGVIAMTPKVIVLDEPTAMLDPGGRREIIKTLKKLNKELNITVILITHYMDEVVDADRIVIINEGEILTQDSPLNIFSQVELIKNIGLDIPQVTALTYELKKVHQNISLALHKEQCESEIIKVLEEKGVSSSN